MPCRIKDFVGKIFGFEKIIRPGRTFNYKGRASGANYSGHRCTLILPQSMIRSIITLYGYSALYRGQASFLHGTGGGRLFHPLYIFFKTPQVDPVWVSLVFHEYQSQNENIKSLKGRNESKSMQKFKFSIFYHIILMCVDNATENKGETDQTKEIRILNKRMMFLTLVAVLAALGSIGMSVVTAPAESKIFALTVEILVLLGMIAGYFVVKNYC